MKRLTRTLLVAAIVLAVVSISAAPAGAKRGGTDRPFKASGSGSNIVSEDECVFNAETFLLECPQAISTTFIGTHIGRSANSSSGTAFLDIFAAPPSAPGCEKDGQPGGTPFVTTQTGEIVAANGDKLNFETVTEDCFLAGVEATYYGTWTIDGGTGRFDGASGSGDLAATVLNQTISTEWTGTISY